MHDLIKEIYLWEYKLCIFIIYSKNQKFIIYLLNTAYIRHAVRINTA